MIRREIETTLIKSAAEYPVITLMGPRQSGKTTVAKAVFPKHSYANLERPDIRVFAESDPLGFFSRFPAPVIIDEVQRVPSLISYVQVLVDENPKKKGQYILTGSHQPQLHHAVSQSLAGRTALLTLYPLNCGELHRCLQSKKSDDLLWRGFMPKLYDEDLEPTAYYRNYFRTYVERDVRQILQIRNLSTFERLLTLLAGRVGQIVNLSSLGGEVGVSHATITEWLSILEASHIIFRLQPYFSNIGKRIIKSPKLYFSEIGLATYLLGIESPDQAARDPLRGGLFENMVIADIFKTRLNMGLDPNLFYLRDSKGFEIDLIIRKGRSLIPVEIKSGMTFHPDFTRNIRLFCEREPLAISPAVIYDGEELPSYHGVRCLNFKNSSQLLAHE